MLADVNNGMILRGNRRAALVAAGVMAAALAGCSAPAGRRDGAADVAVRFASEVSSGALAQSCDLLAQNTIEALTKGGGSCADAVRKAGLQDPGQVTGTQVWGRSALVRFTGSVAFLTEVDGAWRVTAAGCAPRQASPADCALEAG